MYKTIVIILLVFIVFIIIFHYIRQRKVKCHHLKTLFIQKIDQGPLITVGNHKLYIYNPSIIENNDGRILCVARITNQSKSWEAQSDILKNDKIQLDPFMKFSYYFSSLILFDLRTPNNFRIINPFHLEQLCATNFTNGIEDPRLFRYRNQIWVYAHFRGKVDRKCLHSPIIFKLESPESIIYLHTDNMSDNEKNWMPFVYNHDLYFEYKVSPHIILKCDVNTGKCTEVYTTYAVEKYPLLTYNKFGCGAPSQLIKIKNKEFFIGLAHISLTIVKHFSVIRKNFFYIFQNHPPFKIVMIGTEFTLTGDQNNIEFATGLIVKKDHILLSSGIDDCYSIIAKINLESVFDTLYIRFDKENKFIF